MRLAAPVTKREPHISPELHARIMRAVNRLRFEPHSAAQALRSRESKTIGCMAGLPLYSEMINGAEEEFQRAGYVLMLAATRHEQDRETAFISAVRRRRMDGLLLFAGDNAHTASPARSQISTCLAWRSIAKCLAFPRCARIIAAAASKSRDISSGSAIAVSRCSPAAPRCCRVRSALPATGRPMPRQVLKVDPDLIRPQTQGSSIAFSDVCQLLQGPDRPTAIITLGTHMLAGVMDALASNGLRYPDDMSLVCIGDTDLARHATPGISALTWRSVAPSRHQGARGLAPECRRMKRVGR